MRIALFSEVFLPKVDGVVLTLCRLLDYLADHGHESILFAPEGGPDRYAETKVIGLRGLEIPSYPGLKWIPPLYNFAQQLYSFRPDLVHLINPVSLGLGGMQSARRLEIPVVASYQTDIPGYMNRWGWGIFQDPLWECFRRLHNLADLNLCPSRWTQAEIQAHGFRRVQLWDRGVDTSLFHPSQRSAEVRNRLTGGLNSRPLMLFVGRLSSEKRVDWLRPVLEKNPGTVLAVVGDGPSRRDLEEQLANLPAVFTGCLSGRDLAQACASADIFVFPSANETLGNVVLEALASGLPVVAPRSGGLIDHVVDGGTGFLTPPESVSEFIQAAGKLAKCEPKRREMGSAGREKILSLDWEDVFSRLMNQYGQVIRRRKVVHAIFARPRGESPILFRKTAVRIAPLMQPAGNK